MSQLVVLEVLFVELSAVPMVEHWGGFALRSEAAAALALSAVARCSKRCLLQRHGWRFHAAAERRMARCWQRQYSDQRKVFDELLTEHADVDEPLSLESRFRQVLADSIERGAVLQSLLRQHPALRELAARETQRARFVFGLRELVDGEADAEEDDGEAEGEDEEDGEADAEEDVEDDGEEVEDNEDDP
jgi:hypothetical protein